MESNALFIRMGYKIASGLSYGTHLLLYKNENEHSIYAVFILSTYELSWRCVLGINRTCSSANKVLLILDPRLKSCICVKRWKPF